MDGVKTKVEAAVEALSSYANSFSPDRKGFADAIRKDHRTLQQEVMKTFVALIDGWAEDYDKGRFDARNEATVKLAKELREITKMTYIPYI